MQSQRTGHATKMNPITVSINDNSDKKELTVNNINIIRPNSLKLEPAVTCSQSTMNILALSSSNCVNSPDIKLFGLQGNQFLVTSPDIDKLLNQLNATSPQTPTSFLNPKNVTQDQEQFANAFTKKLCEIKAEHESGSDKRANQNGEENLQFTDISYSNSYHALNNISTAVSHSSDVLVNTNGAAPQLVLLSGHQNIASSAPSSVSLPVISSQVVASTQMTLSAAPNHLQTNSDYSGPGSNGPSSVASSMDINQEENKSINSTKSKGSKCKSKNPPSDQQLAKLERKRARNRDAARKCRERKVSLIKQLENEVNSLTDVNKSLQNKVKNYRIEVEKLKRFVIDHHAQTGCEIVKSNNS